jgi:hypothetical protein
MFTRFDKAYVALLVSFGAATVLQFTGFTIDPMVQSGIVAVLTAALTWLVPNKS